VMESPIIARSPRNPRARASQSPWRLESPEAAGMPRWINDTFAFLSSVAACAIVRLRFSRCPRPRVASPSRPSNQSRRGHAPTTH
jgi:hypothetical protein